MPYRRFLIYLIWGCLIHNSTLLWAQSSADRPGWLLRASNQVFRDHQPKRMWLKLDLAPLVQQWDAQQIQGMVSLSLEHKIQTAWSGLVRYQRQYSLNLRPDASLSPTSWIGLDVGVRYYYRLRQDLKMGLQADNLNGSYLGLTLGTRVEPPRYSTQPEWYSDNLAIALLCGTQRQVFRFGYSDVGFGVQVSYDHGRQARFIYPIQVRRGWQVYPVAHLNLGLGW